MDAERVYDAKYLGGHKAHPKETKTLVFIYPESIELGALGLWIPYKSISNIENMDEKKISKSRIVLVGVIGLVWKKKHIYTVLEYHDGYEIQTVVLDFHDAVETAQPIIYNRMVEAKRKEQEQEEHSQQHYPSELQNRIGGPFNKEVTK